MEPQPLAERALGALAPGQAGIAGLVPFGIGTEAPHPLAAVVQAAWRNRATPLHARAVLDSVCTECALGGRGVVAANRSGDHVCRAQLRALHRHTAPAFDPSILASLSGLGSLPPDALADLGRIGSPYVRMPDDGGFQRSTWTRATELLGDHRHDGGLWLHGDSPNLETSFAFGRAAEAIGGTIAAIGAEGLHASATGLQAALGTSTSPGDIPMFGDADLIVLWGLDPEDAPSILAWLADAKQRGARVVVVDPTPPQTLQRAWVPRWASTVFGSRLADDLVTLNEGADESLIRALSTHLVRWNVRRTAAFQDAGAAWISALEHSDARELAGAAGVSEGTVEWLAKQLAQASRPLSVWGSGFTRSGSAVAGLARLHGLIGAPRRLLALPKGTGALHAQAAGLSIAAPAADARPEVVVTLCANALDGPDPQARVAMLSAAALRVHIGTHLDPSMLADGTGPVVVLPIEGPHEQAGGALIASAERRIRFSEAVPRPRHVGEIRPSWRVPADVVAALSPEREAACRFDDLDALRGAITTARPALSDLRLLRQNGHWMQVPATIGPLRFTDPE